MIKEARIEESMIKKSIVEEPIDKDTIEEPIVEITLESFFENLNKVKSFYGL